MSEQGQPEPVDPQPPDADDDEQETTEPVDPDEDATPDDAQEGDAGEAGGEDPGEASEE